MIRTYVVIWKGVSTTYSLVYYKTLKEANEFWLDVMNCFESETNQLTHAAQFSMIVHKEGQYEQVREYINSVPFPPRGSIV